MEQLYIVYTTDYKHYRSDYATLYVCTLESARHVLVKAVIAELPFIEGLPLISYIVLDDSPCIKVTIKYENYGDVESVEWSLVPAIT